MKERGNFDQLPGSKVKREEWREKETETGGRTRLTWVAVKTEDLCGVSSSSRVDDCPRFERKWKRLPGLYVGVSW